MMKLLPFVLCVIATMTATAQEVTIENVRPGELGKFILKQVDNLRDVESLTIQSGTLNDKDFTLLYEGLRNIRHLDIYGISNTYFPYTYNAGSFKRCDSLRSVRLPKNLDRLGSTYSSDNSTRPFEDCASLESIDIPAGVRQLPFYSFSGCRRLREVILHEGLERIGQYAFGDCDSLRTITLPSTLVQADGAFGGCDNLYEVICLATTPPILKERDLFDFDMNYKGDYMDLFMKGRVLTSPKAATMS